MKTRYKHARVHANQAGNNSFAMPVDVIYYQLGRSRTTNGPRFNGIPPDRLQALSLTREKGAFKVFCPERARLLAEYGQATAKLVELSKTLSDAAISYELDAFQHVWDRVHTASEDCARIRKALTLHLEEHGGSLKV